MVKPKNISKFLGVTISSNLGWKDHTSRLCEKIRFADNGIRVLHGRFFSVKDKCLLFKGWIRGAAHANALVFLPFLIKGELDDIRSAMNAGIRVVLGLRRFGCAGMLVYPLREIGK